MKNGNYVIEENIGGGYTYKNYFHTYQDAQKYQTKYWNKDLKIKKVN